MSGSDPWALVSSVTEAPQRKPRSTSIPMLQHAARDVEAAFEALPHHRRLRFERFDVETLTFLPPKVNITKFRLVLGSIKNSHDVKYTPVYAYICRREHIDRALLLWGSNHLTVKDMDKINWAVPFNVIYDTYGQTERASEKIGTMAAYYFLVASRVSEITTQNGNFARNLIKLVQRLYVPVANVEALSHEVSTPDHATCYPENDTGAVVQVEEQRRTPDVAPELTNQTNIGRGQAIHADSEILPKDNTGIIAVNYKIENNGSRDLVLGQDDQFPCVNSTSLWESSVLSPNQGSIHHHQLLNSQTHGNQKLGTTLVELGDDAPEIKSGGSSAVTKRLLPFVQVSKEGKIESSRSQKAGLDLINLHEILGETYTKSQRVYTELEGLWNRDAGLSSKIKLLGEKLPVSSTDSGIQHRNFELDIHEKQSSPVLKLHAQEGIQLQCMTLENERKEHQRLLVKLEQECTFGQKMDALQADLQTMRTENQKLKAELGAEKAAFREYKKKIRNLSMIP